MTCLSLCMCSAAHQIRNILPSLSFGLGLLSCWILRCCPEGIDAFDWIRCCVTLYSFSFRPQLCILQSNLLKVVTSWLRMWGLQCTLMFLIFETFSCRKGSSRHDTKSSITQALVISSRQKRWKKKTLSCWILRKLELLLAPSELFYNWTRVCWKYRYLFNKKWMNK